MFSQQVEKHCGKRRKLLITSIFSCSLIVFKRLVLHQGLNGKGSTFYETTQFKTGPNCKNFADDKNKLAKMIILSVIGLETLLEMEKMLVTTMFSKGFTYRVVQSPDFVLKS